MKTTNERFDEFYEDNICQDHKDCSNECENKICELEQKERLKTFIQEEKNLLLDQAIEVLRRTKFNPRKVSKPFGQDYKLHDDVIDQAVSKLKELKKEV